MVIIRSKGYTTAAVVVVNVWIHLTVQSELSSKPFVIHYLLRLAV
jgi:hypothetical protein